MAEPARPIAREARIKCPVLETGRNSVSPSTAPRMPAWKRFIGRASVAVGGRAPSSSGARLVRVVDAPERVADLAERDVGLHGVDDGRDEVPVAARCLLDALRGEGGALLVARGAEGAHALRLTLLERRIEHEGRRRRRGRVAEAVHPDDDLFAPFDGELELVRAPLDRILWIACFDGADRAAQRV